MTTFYDLLNINLNESNENIKESYKNKIKNYKYKNLNNDDILVIKQLKTALFILLNKDLRELYNNLILSNDKNSDDNWKINGLNSTDNADLNSLFDNNIINNIELTPTITKSSSLEKVNNFINERIFNNINQNQNQNKIIYNSMMPIQTREDRKLTN